MKYRDAAGFVALRVTTEVVEQTDWKDLALHEPDLRVLGTFGVQLVSQLQLRAQFGSAQLMMMRIQSSFVGLDSHVARTISQKLRRMIKENRRMFKSATSDKAGCSSAAAT